METNRPQRAHAGAVVAVGGRQDDDRLRLLGNDQDIEMSISHTTRVKRKGETDGKDYHFVDRTPSPRMRDEGAFLEWAVVFDNYYGTTRTPVERALLEGRDVLFDVDWQGARDLAQGAAGDVVSVFILPPSARRSKSGFEDTSGRSG